MSALSIGQLAKQPTVAIRCIRRGLNTLIAACPILNALSQEEPV